MSVDTGRGASDGASRDAIESHYDVNREFYRLWLDGRMVYSCALWPDADLDAARAPDADLDAAQVAKLAWHAASAGADGAARVLDVGCGWGAMMRYLREERSVAHVTGLTLSADQADAVESGAAGDGGSEVRLEDWRDHTPVAPYAAIVSIGAFEHFARQELSTAERRAVYRSFFERCAGWLEPGGRLSLQTIAYEDFDPESGPVSAFFTDEIFPESSLPRLSDVVVSAEPDFRLVDMRNDGDQYSATLHLWQRRLEAERDAAIDLVGRTVYRRYVRYLRASRAMFDRRICTLYRFTLERRPADTRTGPPGPTTTPTR